MDTDDRARALRDRVAFAAGATFALNVKHCAGVRMTEADIVERARIQYPLPKIVRPRVVKFEGFSWRYVDGWIEYTHEMTHPRAWHRGTNVAVTDARLAVFIGLYNNPTEVVEDEES